MAHILPEIPPSVLPPIVQKVFRHLKSLPDTYYVWHHLAPWQPEAPDFLIVADGGRVLLVKVSLTSAERATPAAQLLLLDDDRPLFGYEENRVIQTFLEPLRLPPETPLETAVVFPLIPHKQVMESRLQRKAGEPQWVGKEILDGDSKLTWEMLFPSEPMDAILFEKLRQRFTPESVIPADMTVRSSQPARIEAELTNYLLDYNQELAMKTDLEIDDIGQSLSSDFRLSIINGVAGSGKTLILLYRLRLLYAFYPEKRFLVLTHNRPLSRDLINRFYRLTGKLPKNIEWCTFNGWCYRHWMKESTWKEPLSGERRMDLIRQVAARVLGGSGISEWMLSSEIDWLKDQIPLTIEEYLTIERRGRGFRLTVEQRQQMWMAIQEYQSTLEKLGEQDWGDVPRKMWLALQEKKLLLPQYDFILIDEAQFFAPLWIRLIQSALNPQNAHLFLAADPTQGFLGRGASWKSLGLEARGRTHLLPQSYRTTREIMQFASFFYRFRLPDEKDEDILMPDMLNMPNGVFPQVILLNKPQDEIARVANEVAELLKLGCPRKDLLVLHANWNGAKSLIKAINRRVGKDTAFDPKEQYPGNYVRVTTLNAGAGLESPIVFLVGLWELFEEEQSLRLSDEEREALIRDNTKKIYMAATRAGQRLIFTYVGKLPEALENVLKPSLK